MWILILALLGQDFETRYHDAYVLEVVEGDASKAAIAYLDLMRAPELPAALRAQAHFRFAVTCALLGRPDEARARLAELEADKKTPTTLLAPIAEYRKSLAGAGESSELEKRMEDLVFRIAAARSDPPDEYREFEVIGAPAVPFLRKLMHHNDTALREHAFRMLCRMDVGGLGGAREAEWDDYSDFERYLLRNPREVAAAEKWVLGLADDRLALALNALWSVPELSTPFLDALSARPGAEGVLPGMHGARHRLEGWIREGSEVVGRAAAEVYATSLGGEGVVPNASLFPIFCERIVGTAQASKSVKLFAGLLPPETVLAYLEERIEGPLDITVFTGVLDSIAAKEMDVSRVDALLERWIAKAEARGDAKAVETTLRYFGGILEELREERVVTITRRAARSEVSPSSLRTHLRFLGPRGAPRLLAAVEATSGDRRFQIQYDYLSGLGPDLALETRTTVLASFPSMAPYMENEQKWIWHRYVPALATDVDTAIVRTALFAALAGQSSTEPKHVLAGAGNSSREREAWLNDVVIPLLPQLDSLPPGRMRNELPGRILTAAGSPDDLSESSKRLLADYHRAHPGLGLHVQYAAAIQEFYPPEEWIPLALETQDWTRVSVSEPDRVARALAAKPDRANLAVIRFIASRASPDVAAECLGQLFRAVEPVKTRLFLGLNIHVDPALLRERLLAMNAQPTVPLGIVADLCQHLAARAPSAELFPVVRRVLTSAQRDTLMRGIEIAKTLGHEDLLPALVGLLDSLDWEVRGGATVAIDSILGLRRLKGEVRQRIAENSMK